MINFNKSYIFLFLFSLTFCANFGLASENTAQEWFKKGIENIEITNYEKAIFCFQQTIALYPNHMPSYSNLGYVYNIQGLWDLAIETYKKAIAIDSNDALMHHDLGFSLHQKGMLDEAINEFTTAILINPQLVASYQTLGYVYIEKKLFDKAVQTFKKALTFDANHPETYCGLGQAYKSIGKSILSADCYYQAGIHYLKKHNREEALQSYKNILSCSWEIAGVFLKQLYPLEKSYNAVLPKVNKQKKRYILLTQMNIRKHDSIDSEIIGQLDENTKFQIIKESPNNTPISSWYLIRTSFGFSGWLAGVHQGSVKYTTALE